MSDCVLIQQDRAHEIWRETAKATLIGRYAPELIAQMVEVASGTVQVGDVWTGTTFIPAPVPPPRDRDVEIDGMLHLRALARATFELKTTPFTLQQFLDRIKQIYRNL